MPVLSSLSFEEPGIRSEPPSCRGRNKTLAGAGDSEDDFEEPMNLIDRIRSRKKQILLFLPALLFGTGLLAFRGHLEQQFGASLAEGDLYLGFARLTDSERDITETRQITDEVASEAGAIDPRAGSQKNGSEPVSRTTLELLRQRRKEIRSWAPLCEDGSPTYHECPSPEAIRFSGLLCLSGDFKACNQVREAMDESGRFWRGKVFIGRENGDLPSFSSSSARGVMAYLATRWDRETMSNWLAYIQKTEGRFCPDVRDPDNQCRIRAYFWHLAWQLNEGLKFLPETDRDTLPYRGFLMVRNEDPKRWGRDTGYDILGTAETILILREMRKKMRSISDEDLILAVSQVLYHRHPEQPLLRYLVNGADEAGARLLLNACPGMKPFPKMENGWPRHDLEFTPGAALGKNTRIGGHYCIFLMNLLLGSAK